MTNSTKLHIAAYSLLAVIVIVAFVSYMGAHEDKIKAEATEQAQKQIIEQAQKSMADREYQWKNQQQQFQNQIDSIRTAAQARQTLQPVVIQAGSQPIAGTQVTKQDLPQSVQSALPDAPSATKYTLLSEDQFTALAKREVSCQEKEAGLNKCTADKTDLQTQVVAEKVEVESWKKAAKGGGFLHRFGRTARDIGIGVAVGYALHSIHK